MCHGEVKGDRLATINPVVPGSASNTQQKKNSAMTMNWQRGVIKGFFTSSLLVIVTVIIL